ncbi:hypothetical protein LEN26_017395 [Aphanomyces euteiches]|nr:hypothetical protein LEN26_017395 [Aphanomyces euteiches]KAH9107472.1 hypothetical protein AeMF1_017187 [Aphanomyces euteiches]KAH9185420.1 hypothetical protein AeNC1_012600 [Aphanomyces euteiches]
MFGPPPYSPMTLAGSCKLQDGQDSSDVSPFLVKVRRMLACECPSIIRWNAQGTAIEILSVELFKLLVLPKYFRRTKYSSFQRQLNYFGFKKWTKRKAAVCTFSHTYFTRDDPDLAVIITRRQGRRGVLDPLPIQGKVCLTMDDMNCIVECLNVSGKGNEALGA